MLEPVPEGPIGTVSFRVFPVEGAECAPDLLDELSNFGFRDEAEKPLWEQFWDWLTTEKGWTVKGVFTGLAVGSLVFVVGGFIIVLCWPAAVAVIGSSAAVLAVTAASGAAAGAVMGGLAGRHLHKRIQKRLATTEAQVRTLIQAQEAHEAEIGRLTAEQAACRSTIAQQARCMERQDLVLAEMRQMNATLAAAAEQQRREFEESRAANAALIEAQRRQIEEQRELLEIKIAELKRQ
jgi:hypothetical protein